MKTEGGTLVIGGGLAGGAAALSLARGGRSVTLLEKSKAAHHKVCGEFLSHEALHYLQGLGVDLHALGAVPLRRVRFIGRVAELEELLPFAACSLSRHVLDEHLLERATAEGVDVRRDYHVERVAPAGDGWQVAVRGRASCHAPSVFLASGKHDVPALRRPAGKHPGLVGFKMHFLLSPEQHTALGDAVELILFRGGYAGLQPIENGAANLCLLIAAKALKRIGGDWKHLLAHLLGASPHLARRLGGADPLFSAPLAVASIPYGFLQRRSEDGLWRVGDQAAVIPSFSGDGMAIALHSGVLAAQCFLRGDTADHFQRTLATGLRRRLALATSLSQLLVRQPQLAELVRFWPALLPRLALTTRIRTESLLQVEAIARG